MTVLQQYHRVWLEAHPNRSTEWLKERIRDGFDIHHLDGNRGNNTAENLILVEHADHNLIHTRHRYISRQYVAGKGGYKHRRIYGTPIGPKCFWKENGKSMSIYTEAWKAGQSMYARGAN